MSGTTHNKFCYFIFFEILPKREIWWSKEINKYQIYRFDFTMEANDLEETTQDTIECDQIAGCSNLDVEIPNKQQEQPMTSQYLSSTKSNTVLRLTQRKKNICDKLATKKQQLQLHKSNLKGNDEKKKNGMKVSKALENMISSKINLSNRNADIHLHKESLLNSDTKPNGIILSADLGNPLPQYSKQHLMTIVEGLQELVLNLTQDDGELKSKAEIIASNIYGLRNFNIFSNENCPSFSGTRRQRHDSDLYQEEQSTSKERNILKKPENKKDAFIKYINVMLSEYFGEQSEKIDMYKCLASHLEDLELYASTLVHAGIGSIVESDIRINRKNNRRAFISMSADRKSSEPDGQILLPVARQYAFEGDIVKAFVLHSVTDNAAQTDSNEKLRNEKENSLPLDEDEEFFEDAESCRKAFVIKIVKQTELREVVGSISFKNASTLNSKLYYKLKPHDMRVPIVYIPEELCREENKAFKKTDVCGMLYIVRVLETDINGHCIGELVQSVGKVGNLQAEIKAILLHNGLKDVEPYEQKFNDWYDQQTIAPNDEDLKYREDLRKKCVFTIDPLTAKDLDDAMSVEKLNSFEYEIGVHIADVSFYLEENSELDNLVKHRATSIYLVNEVIHMLPPSLCFKCSLLPGEDKFAFSVFWKWHTQKEQLSEPRFTRSIMNSCCQFAYEHVQKIIDNPMEKLEHDDIPDLLNEWTPNDIKGCVLFLHEVSQKLKANRYRNGALSINNPKLRFQLDPRTGEPLVYEIEDRQDANFLVEEFMLLANQSVAKFIHDHFPEISILRNHSPPLGKFMKSLKKRLNQMGLEFDISSSKSIYESMKRLTREADDPKAMEACLSTLLTKPMSRASYYCSEGKTLADEFWHYALSIPIYTHFTSPIRRYADILVHRLLAAALDYCPPPQRTTDELHQLAKICNDQKYNAKNAGDESIELFFKRYVKAKQPLKLRAVVIELYKESLNVLVIKTGHTIKIDFKSQKVLVDTTAAPSSITIIEKNSQLPPTKLQLFSTVDINIVLQNEQICGNFATADINQRRSNSKKSSNNDNYAANRMRDRLQSTNSISEENDDNIQASDASTSKNRRRRPRRR